MAFSSTCLLLNCDFGARLVAVVVNVYCGSHLMSVTNSSQINQRSVLAEKRQYKLIFTDTGK